MIYPFHVSSNKVYLVTASVLSHKLPIDSLCFAFVYCYTAYCCYCLTMRDTFHHKTLLYTIVAEDFEFSFCFSCVSHLSDYYSLTANGLWFTPSSWFHRTETIEVSFFADATRSSTQQGLAVARETTVNRGLLL